MPMKDPETIEQAREMLVQYNNDLTAARAELDSLRTQSAEKDSEIDELRKLNQRLFLQLPQVQEDPEPEPEPVQTLEEFAKTLKGVI